MNDNHIHLAEITNRFKDNTEFLDEYILSHYELIKDVIQDLFAIAYENQSKKDFHDAVESLFYVANFYKINGDSSIWDSIDVPDDENFLIEVRQNIECAIEMINIGDYCRARELLEEILNVFDETRGTAPDYYLPRVYGYLGVIEYNQRNFIDAFEYSKKALDICIECNDFDGCIAYSGTMIKLNEESGSYQDHKKYIKIYIRTNWKRKNFLFAIVFSLLFSPYWIFGFKIKIM